MNSLYLPAPSARLLTPALMLAFLAASPLSFAQTTIRMTTAQSTNCVAVTDASGLTLVPGGTDLQATGVALSGSGCGAAGSTDFQAAISAPGTATVGTAFNVTWSASQAATQCIYGAPASGVSGWPTGTSACSGAACTGSHTVPVTINTAGTYNFSVACTNATGVATSAGVVATGAVQAPSPDNFDLVVTPASPVAGTPFSVSWSVNNATECDASVSGAATSLPGWTTVNSATSPRSVTAAAGTYTLSLVCKNSVGQVTSKPATVVVSPTTGACVGPTGLTRLATSNIGYGPTSSPIRSSMTVTEWDNIWGHFNSTDAVKAWPGYGGSGTTLMQFARTNFLAAHFKTPANATSGSTLNGYFIYPVNLPGPNADMKISKTCGDFSPDTSNPGCLATNVATSDEALVRWKFTPGNTAAYCILQPNTDYYVNIKFTDPNSTVECAAGSTICPLPTVHQFGGSL